MIRMVRMRIGLAVGATALLLSIGHVRADSNGQRLTEAVKARDHQTVRALLKERVDVNVPLADGATALHWAVHWNDSETVSRLVRAGARINARDDHGTTPLFLASVNGDAALVDALLEAGADVTIARQTGVTPLMAAARAGNVDVVRALLQRGADVNAKESTHDQTALMWAVAANHTGIVKLLLDNRANVNARTPPRRTPTSVSGQYAGGECCLPNYVGGFTALLFSAQQGHIESTRQLLAAGANVNDTAADGTSALVLAIDSAPVVSERVSRNALASHELQEKMAKFLLERGADPNLHGSGRTALHSAVQRKMPELLKALLDGGADPNARLERRLPSVSRDVGIQNGMDVNTIGATPFWLASSYGDLTSMRILLEHGADPLLATVDHSTPLMVAAGIDFVDGQDKYGVRTFDQDISHLVTRARDAIALCLERSIDVNAANDKGQTALFGAVYMGSPLLVQLLADRGARLNVLNSQKQTPWSVAALGEYRAGSFFIKKEAGELLEKLGADTSLGARVK
jgi:ankyrin repeat protein